MDIIKRSKISLLILVVFSFYSLATNFPSRKMDCCCSLKSVPLLSDHNRLDPHLPWLSSILSCHCPVNLVVQNPLPNSLAPESESNNPVQKINKKCNNTERYSFSDLARSLCGRIAAAPSINRCSLSYTYLLNCKFLI
jgi:hypothetical protein